MTTRPPLLRRTLRTGLLAAGMAAVLGTAALAPAMADEDDWHRGGDRDRHEQVWRDHDDHDRGRDRDWDRDRAYAAPGYAYYPAPGYGYSYAPAPAYAAPGLSLGFVFR